jgi:hypothetical protein
MLVASSTDLIPVPIPSADGGSRGEGREGGRGTVERRGLQGRGGVGGVSADRRKRVGVSVEDKGVQGATGALNWCREPLVLWRSSSARHSGPAFALTAFALAYAGGICFAEDKRGYETKIITDIRRLFLYLVFSWFHHPPSVSPLPSVWRPARARSSCTQDRRHLPAAATQTLGEVDACPDSS